MGKQKKTKQPAQVEVKPTTINGVQDPEAVAAMAPPKIQVSARKAAKAQSAAKKRTSKPNHPKAKITFRHNFLPPIVGIVAFVEVLAILNMQWVSAQYQYHFSKPVTVTNTTAIADNPDPNAPARIIIPDIGVDAPIVTDEHSYNQTTVQKALQRGTLLYGASAEPGHNDNVVIVGHSSGQLWAPGNYKFVFTLLDKLQQDDRIFIDFKGKRYIYRVSTEKVVPPTDISVLQHTNEAQLTLITCTPVGTSTNRLVITARQVSPHVSANTTPLNGAQRPVTSTVIPN